jgi:hypothetical protein
MTGESLPREGWKQKFEKLERQYIHMRRRCEHAEKDRDAALYRLDQASKELDALKRKYGLTVRQGSLLRTG